MQVANGLHLRLLSLDAHYFLSWPEISPRLWVAYRLNLVDSKATTPYSIVPSSLVRVVVLEILHWIRPSTQLYALLRDNDLVLAIRI